MYTEVCSATQRPSYGMPRRTSTRIAAAAAAAAAASASASTTRSSSPSTKKESATGASAAPQSKRRRKDSPADSATRDSKTKSKGDDTTTTESKKTKPRAKPLAAEKGVGRGMPTPSSGGSDGSSVVMVRVPSDFSFSQAACSYGYYIVPPNLWVPCKEDPSNKEAGTFSRPLRFGESLSKTAECTISQVSRDAKDPEEEKGEGKAEGEGSLVLKVDVAARLTPAEEEEIQSQVVRMFNINVDLEPWFDLSAEAKERKYGRLFRSPTLFEDMVKCITGCNMTFQGTIRMNRLLCEVFGLNQAFPTPEDLEGIEPEDLKENAKVGYRAERILKLAQSFRDGTVDPDWLQAPERTREEVLKYVKNLHGFGPYAAGNVVMLLGFYEEVPMDSETVRHFKDFHGVTTKNVKEVEPKVKKQYEPYAPYQFLQYWYEMIVWHERKRGLEVHLWDSSDFATI